jgi:hypothetical protein
MGDIDREVVERIQKLSDEHWWALNTSCALMAAETWMGPTGDRFGADVHGDQRELRDMLANAVASAKDKLTAEK